jgi:hypothetical protein
MLNGFKEQFPSCSQCELGGTQDTHTLYMDL